MAVRPQHNVRMDDLTWREFGDATRGSGSDRSAVLRQFILWYLRRAPLPPRPPARMVFDLEAMAAVANDAARVRS